MLKAALSWLIGGLVSIIFMLIFMKITGIDIPNWLGFILMVGLVIFIQRSIFKLKFGVKGRHKE